MSYRYLAFPVLFLVILSVLLAGCASVPVRLSDTHNITVAVQSYNTWTVTQKAYNQIRNQHGVGTDYGDCNRTVWNGEGAWLHNPETKNGKQQPPKRGGRQFCYFDGNVAVIVWWHQKNGQPTHIDLLGVARAGGNDHFDLFGWYQFWRHKLGKCLGTNCEARLS